MSGVKRVFVEKKKPFAVNAKELLEEIGGYLGIKTITDVRVLIRYDIENLSEETYKKALTTVFSEPPVDDVYEGTFPAGKDDFVFSVEYLPGQFDQRADSAEQCVKFFNENEIPVIKTAVTYVLTGTVTDQEKNRIKEHCINPVDSRQAAEDIPETLVTEFKTPADVIYFDGFKDMPEDKLKELYDSLGLAMTFKDFKFIQEHFAGVEKRDPSMTEIRVLDTYWSDHCRHTTFATELTDVKFKDGFYKAPMEATYNKYLSDRAEIYKDRKDKFVCLMDLALMGAKKLKAEGKLADQEESDEINACSIVVPVEIDGKTEEWLVNFKNETHNHPTEIEPFGGAATCLGGAIRDPLSGRTYVYQAMRITGAADPTVPVSETIHGKLPQRKLVTGAAHGYSSYGNQIGLATGYVKEIYHPDYVAKRMEIGAVIAAAPRSAVKRENSDPGDIIILLGGRTGRDGCGGATGSSKVHTEKSIEDCGAEVQKGNAPTERKMQRLFRRPEVTKLIKKCNDFGAGGVSVAIGELAPGIRPVSFSFGKQSSSEPSFQQLEIVPLSSPALFTYLQERGINIALAKRECKEAHFTHKGKRYFAIAFPNMSGGYEIRNRYFKGCISPKEISHIRQSGTARETCYVFEGFMDYLSFLTLRLENCPKYPELDRQDYMVLNSVANVSKALYPLGSYERIHCFFDNDRAGMEALQQIRMEYGRDLYIRDASQTYSGCKDLNEYLQKQAERNRQVQSAKGTRSQPPKKKNGFWL